MRLTLLVPELIWPEPADQIALGEQPTDGLSWLEARARFSRQARQPFELALSRLFQPEISALAALRLLGENDGEAARDGYWLCARRSTASLPTSANFTLLPHAAGICA